VRDALNSINQNLRFLIDLKPEERQAMSKYGEKNRSFVVKALTIAEQNPDILPRNFSLADMQARFAMVDALYPLIVSVTNLLGKLEDTHFAAGSEVYDDARLVYRYAKTANIATGELEDAVDELGHHFAKHPKSTPPDSSSG
jgi:hypothetical protein